MSPIYVPLVSIPAPTMHGAPTKSPYSQTVSTAPRAARLVPNLAPTIQSTACSPRVDPTTQSPTMYPTAQPTSHSPRVVMAPLNSTDPISHRTCSRAPIPPRMMKPSPAKRAQSKAFPNWPMPISLPPLTPVTNSQPLSSPSSPFLTINRIQGKLLSITNSLSTFISRRTRTSLNQTN